MSWQKQLFASWLGLLVAVSLAAAQNLDARQKAAADTGFEADKPLVAARAPVISAVAMKPGGDQIATAGDDHVIRLWSRTDGKLLYLLRGHQDWVRATAYSPDGNTLVSVGDDRQVILWDSSTGDRIATLPAATEALCDVAFCADGVTIATVGFDRSVGLYSIAGRQAIAKIDTTCKQLRCVAFSPDGERLVTGGKCGKVFVCDVAGAKPAFEIQTSLNRVRKALYSPDGQMIVTAGEGNAIEMWDAATGHSIGRFSSMPGRIFSLAFCGNTHVATGGSDNIVRIWSLVQQAEQRELKGHVGSVAALAFDSHTMTLASGGFDTAIRIWRIDAIDPKSTAAIGITEKR